VDVLFGNFYSLIQRNIFENKNVYLPAKTSVNPDAIEIIRQLSKIRFKSSIFIQTKSFIKVEKKSKSEWNFYFFYSLN
jgi:hypothetical protein